MEHLWATPVDATDTGGTYRLANSGFHSPLVIDDIVEARRNGDNLLQVIGMRERGGRPGWLIHLDENEPEVEELIDEWRATGAVVELRCGTVSVALDATRGADARPTEAELRALSRFDLVVGYLRLSGGAVFTAAEAAWIDLGPA